MGWKLSKGRVFWMAGALLWSVLGMGQGPGTALASSQIKPSLLLAQSTHQRAAQLAKAGREAFGHKDWQKAREAFDASLALNPAQPYLLNARGVTFLQLNEIELAIADFEACREQLPEQALPYFNLGNAYRLQKKLPEAIAAYTEAIARNPKYVAAYNNRGISYSERQDYAKALADYNQSLKLNPRDIDVRNNRGYLYLLQKNYPKALQDFNAVLRKNPKHALAYGNKARVLYQQGNCEEAIQLLDKSCELGNVKACRAARRVNCNTPSPEVPDESSEDAS